MNHKTIIIAAALAAATLTAGAVRAERVDSHPACPAGTDHAWRQDVNDGAFTIIPGSTGGWTLTAIVVELVGGGTLVMDPTTGPVWVGPPGATSFLLCKGEPPASTTVPPASTLPDTTTSTEPPASTLPDTTTSTLPPASTTPPTSSVPPDPTTTVPRRDCDDPPWRRVGQPCDSSTTVVVVTDPPVPTTTPDVPTPTLPRTGHDDPASTLWLAVGLATLGGLLIGFARRRSGAS